MKRLTSWVSVLALVLGVSGLALAGDTAAAPSSMQGWIVDSFCGAANANLEGQKCAKDCFKKGAKLQLVADGKTYEISDQQKAAEHLGHEVVVTGTVDKDTITVTKIEAAKKEKA